MKGLIIDFRKQGRGHASIYINGAEVEMVKSIKFRGVTIIHNLSWSTHIDVMIKKAQQCLYFLRGQRKFSMSVKTLTDFYRCNTEGIQSGCIVAWYSNCSAQDHEKLQRIMNTARSIIDSIYTSCCLRKATALWSTYAQFCHNDATQRLEEQHLIFHLGTLRPNGLNVDFTSFKISPPLTSS
eukprot:g23919.t1